MAGALVAIAVGVLGLTAQNVLTGDDATPRPPFPSASITPSSTAGSLATPSGSPSSPSLTIAEPADDATVASNSVTIRVDVLGFRIAAQPSSTNVAGEGHLIYYRDVDFVPTQPGSPARTEPGTFAASSELTHTWSGLDPGRHAFFVQLVNNDDTPLAVSVVDSVVVTVTTESASPSVGPTPSASP